MQRSPSHLAALAAALAAATAAQAAPITTTDLALVQAFQQGLTVETFENVGGGRTPMALSSYTSGLPVAEAAQVYDQVAGVRFSVGGTVGVNRPALYELGGGLAGDAHSGDTVLGTVDFDGNTNFDRTGLLEAFLPTKVSSLGFWLNPALGDAIVYFLNTNFAFSREEEVILGSVRVKAGEFVGLQLDGAQIGGLKVGALRAADGTSKGFTIDDFSYGGSGSSEPPGHVPEPGSLALVLAALLAGGAVRRHRIAAD